MRQLVFDSEVVSRFSKDSGTGCSKRSKVTMPRMDMARMQMRMYLIILPKVRIAFKPFDDWQPLGESNSSSQDENLMS